jgi:hypothetical protein
MIIRHEIRKSSTPICQKYLVHPQAHNGSDELINNDGNFSSSSMRCLYSGTKAGQILLMHLAGLSLILNWFEFSSTWTAVAPNAKFDN